MEQCIIESNNKEILKLDSIPKATVEYGEKDLLQCMKNVIVKIITQSN